MKSVCLSDRVRFRAVGDEGVLVHLESGRVIVVSEVGFRIVQSLDSPKTRTDLADILVEEYDVNHSAALADVESYLNEMDRENLLEHTN